MERTTREQERAQEAYRRVKGVPEGAKKEYGRHSLKLPALIHHCGLCQAVAFLEAKAAGDAADPNNRLLDDLRLVTKLGTSLSEFTEQVRTADVREYLRMTHEAIASAEWLKRYVEAFGYTKTNG